MNLSKILKNIFLVVAFGLIVTACATKKSVKQQIQQQALLKQLRRKGRSIEKRSVNARRCLYGSDTVGELASSSRQIFFATNEIILTTASRET